MLRNDAFVLQQEFLELFERYVLDWEKASSCEMSIVSQECKFVIEPFRLSCIIVMELVLNAVEFE